MQKFFEVLHFFNVTLLLLSSRGSALVVMHHRVSTSVGWGWMGGISLFTWLKCSLQCISWWERSLLGWDGTHWVRRRSVGRIHLHRSSGGESAPTVSAAVGKVSTGVKVNSVRRLLHAPWCIRDHHLDYLLSSRSDGSTSFSRQCSIVPQGG